MSSIKRLHDSVVRHGIDWDDLTARVAKNEKIPLPDAGVLVENLYDRRSVSLPVAVAIIDIIVEKKYPDARR